MKIPIIATDDNPLARMGKPEQNCDMDGDRFIARLRAYLDAHPELTPAGVAKSAGLDSSTVRKLLSGENQSIRFATAEKICRALGTTVADFMAGQDQAELTEIARLYSKLSSDEQRILLAAARKLVGDEPVD